MPQAQSVELEFRGSPKVVLVDRDSATFIGIRFSLVSGQKAPKDGNGGGDDGGDQPDDNSVVLFTRGDMAQAFARVVSVTATAHKALGDLRSAIDSQHDQPKTPAPVTPVKGSDRPAHPQTNRTGR